MVPGPSVFLEWDAISFSKVSSQPRDQTQVSALHHPSGSSQCSSPKHPVSCIEPGLATHFIHDILHPSYDTQKFPDTPGSLEGNTEVPATASSEPLLPS